MTGPEGHDTRTGRPAAGTGWRPRAGAVRRLLAVVGIVAVTVLATALPASAHATLTGSDPVSGAAVDSAPTRVTLSFTESVSVKPDAIRVLDSTGARADEGGAKNGASASEAMVALRPGLPAGTYVVSWRVLSADSHPVGGAFAFGVGGPPDAGAAAAFASGSGGSRLVGVSLGVARLFAFVGAALLIGATFFVTVLWPAGTRHQGPVRLIAAGWLLSLVGALGMFVLQGPYSAGTGITDLFNADQLAVSLDSRYGQLLAIRVLALLLAVPLLRRLVDHPAQLAHPIPVAQPAHATHPTHPARVGRAGGREDVHQPGGDGGPGRPSRPSRRGLVELAGLGVALATTMAMIGHASSGRLVWLATVTLTLHTAAMAIWLGGLCVLGLSLPGLSPPGLSLPGRPPHSGDGAAGDRPLAPAPAGELARVLPRWSRTATIAIAVVVLTGALQAWREVGAFGALFDTTYGRLLLYKLWFVLGVLGLGLLARRWVRRHYPTAPSAPSAPSEPTGSAGPEATALAVVGLRRGVLFEVIIGVVVLSVTAILVNTIPGRDAYAPPFSTTAIAGPMTVDVRISPTRTGPQTMHIYTFDLRGQPQRVVEAKAELSLPAAGVGPLEAPLVEVEDGHAVAEGVGVPLPGEWQLRLSLRVNDFDQYVTTVFYRVR